MLSGRFGLALSFQPFKLFACVQFFLNLTHKGTYNYTFAKFQLKDNSNTNESFQSNMQNEKKKLC